MLYPRCLSLNRCFNIRGMIPKIFIFSLLSFFTLIFLGSCQPEGPVDEGPKLTSSTPLNDATDVATTTTLILNFSERFTLSDNPQITLNGEMVSTVLTYKKLTINTPLLGSTDYTLVIPAKTLYNDAGNPNKRIQLHFTTIAGASAVGVVFEAETATLSGNAVVATNYSGYSGTGYVSSGDGNLTFNVSVEQNGFYELAVRFNTTGNKRVNDLSVDGVKTGSMNFEPVSDWTTLQAGKIRLTAGNHTLSIVKNWGYTAYDYIVLTLDTVGFTPFQIASNLVTPNPSLQVVHLYNFLKENFGLKVLSGTAAAHSTNINEAIWVHDQTGKWPAITCFDFIDHTWKNQNWVNYSAPFTLGQEWWNNNGIVALMWHWRDPLRKTEEFYSEKTTFDVSRISDTLSQEYKAMVSDIDIIAVWLKTLKSADIPVLFRPLHEASGRWFWWGAKGPEPCKALWKLIFNRLTVYHGINNLIWVWTTDAKDDNLDWYPGDEYVDILGVDIYSQNGDFSSQVLTFDKIRETFGGKKMVTLSENGVMPDPDNLISDEAGWSWFMTWAGSFVRDPAVNPLSHWQKIMDHQYVLTRDEMPDRSGPTSTFRIPAETETYEVATDLSNKRLMVTPGDQIREYDIRIYDLYGRMRGFYPNQTGDASVCLNQFAEGIYIIRLESGGTIENYKIAF